MFVIIRIELASSTSESKSEARIGHCSFEVGSEQNVTYNLDSV